MALSYTYHGEYNLIVLKGSGKLVPQDFKDFITEFLVKNPEIKTGFVELCDLRNIEANHITHEGVREIVELEHTYSHRPISSRFAFVVDRDIEYGAVRQYGAYTDAKNREIEIFFDIEEAKKWLGIEGLKLD